MSYDVSAIKADLSGVLHGTTVNKITNLASVMTRAARQFLLDCNPIETKRIAQLGQVFNSVYDYSVPTDLKGVQVIDIRPQAGRQINEQYEQAFARWFDANKDGGWNNAFNIQHDTGVKTIRIEAPTLISPVTITDTGATTNWTIGGTGSNLDVDTQFNVAGGGALSFDVTAGTATLGNTSLTSLDMTDHVLVSKMHWWIYIPSASLTSVTVRFGTDLTANYYDFTATTQVDGTAFKAGWNLIGKSWVGLTATGSPTVTAYDSVRFSVVASAAMNGVKVCNLTTTIGEYLEMVYYSKYLFSLNGTWKEDVTDTDSADLTTIVNLDTESYMIYFNLLCYLLAQQLQGSDAQKDGQFFKEEYQKGLKRYTAIYKSETLLPSEPWYQLPRSTRGYNTAPRWFT